MLIKMQFAGVWGHVFEVASGTDQRVGCYAGWTALRAWAEASGREIEPPPMLMLKDVFTKTPERWVPAGFTWPSTEGQLVMAPDPFCTKAPEWEVIFQRIRRAQRSLVVAAPLMDGWDRASGKHEPEES